MNLFLAAVQSVQVVNTPLPVHFTDSLDTIKWTDKGMFWATVGLAIVTALLFNATRSMASQTKLLAKKTADMATETAALASDTVDATDRADEHHQQSLWPLIVVSSLNNYSSSSCSVWLHNIGNGPAQNVQVVLTHYDYQETAPVADTVRPLQAGDKESVNVMFFAADDQRRVHPPADVQSFVFEIRYKTIFGTDGVTKWSWNQRNRNYINFDSVQHPEIQKRERKQRKATA